jgi:hypothetical protein
LTLRWFMKFKKIMKIINSFALFVLDTLTVKILILQECYQHHVAKIIYVFYVFLK